MDRRELLKSLGAAGATVRMAAMLPGIALASRTKFKFFVNPAATGANRHIAMGGRLYRRVG